jgi:KUP system potassium uptake protein
MGRAFISVAVTIFDLLFLFSNMVKIPHGGYWSLIIGAFPLAVILIYTRGQRRLYRALKPSPLQEFLERYQIAYKRIGRIEGTALYFLKDEKEIPPYMIRSMLVNGIIYEENIIVTILKRVDPYGVIGFFKQDIGPGLRVFEIQIGYMEFPDIEEILKEAGIDEKTIFYGIEDIVTGNVIWRIFSSIKRLTPNFVQFHKLPSHKLHGVMTRVKL